MGLGDPIVKVEPGSLTPERAMELILTDKRCDHCGVPLDFWGNYPTSYHSPWCRYFWKSPHHVEKLVP